jgi:hypothetical protein
MLSNMSCHHLSVLRSCVVQDPLDKVVAVLITGDINKRNASPVTSTFADAIKISAEKICAANFQTLFDDFGGELIGAILSSISNDMINGPATIRRCPVLADVLDAPVAKLPVGYNIDIGQHLLNAWTL